MAKYVSRREARRRRRIRNRILAFLVIIILIIGIGVGIFFGVKYLKDNPPSFMLPPVAQEESTEEYDPYILYEEESTEAFEFETETETEEESIDPVDEAEILLNEIVDECIASMPLEDKVAGLFIITPEQLTGVNNAVKAGNGTKEALDKYPVGGLIYFADNIQSESQITEMLANTVSYSRYPLFLAVDEELGDTNRLRKKLKLPEIPSASEIGASGDSTQAYEAYKSIGQYMITYGFNLDFAPVADLLTNADNQVIGDRSFGTDPSFVSSMVSSAVAGLKVAGVSSCVKHFPGQGAADADTHKGIAVDNRTIDEIKNEDVIPFTQAMEVGAEMVMVGHMAVPAITGDDVLPASLSKEVITDFLRGEYRYEGVVITDALNMAAVADYYGSGEAAVKALRAGADMILMPENFEEAYQAVIDAVNNNDINEERINDSLARVYKIKYKSRVE